MEQTSTDVANYTLTTEGVQRHSQLATNIWVYGSPVLIAIGTIGNILSAVVMLRQSLRKCTTSLYLFVLAVVDTLVLYTGLLETWIRNVFESAFKNASIATCRIYLFVFYLVVDIEAWILVCVGVERMVAIFLPHKAKQIFTRTFAARQMAIIGGILAIINSHVYWTCTLVEGRCRPKIKYEDFIEDILPWIDFCLDSLIPFLIMLVANSAIAGKLIHTNHVRKVKLHVGNDKKLTSMTVILFLITFIFLLTTAPVGVFLSIIHHSQEDIERYPSLWASLNLLFYSNFAINFLFYCISGPRFRRELFRMCGRNNADIDTRRQSD